MNTQEAQAELRRLLKPGDTIFTILRHVSRSGMSRRISLLTTDHRQLDWLIDRAGWGRTRKNEEGIVAGGCGMDMGYSLTYSLSRRLFPDGFKVERVGRNGNTSGWDNDGGYALNHRWL